MLGPEKRWAMKAIQTTSREEEDNLEEGFEGDRFLGSAGTLVDTLHATLEEKQQLRNAFRPR
jgi:hypothetical protein